MSSGAPVTWASVTAPGSSPAHWAYWASKGDLANLGLISPDENGDRTHRSGQRVAALP